MHNAIATGLLNEHLQSSLLTQLGVNPLTTPSWPLNIPSRTLSIAAQVLLLKQWKEKDELKSDANNPCMIIWTQVITTVNHIITDKLEVRDATIPLLDINVEHAQVLVFLFHNLKLLQRKQVLLTLSQAIAEVTEPGVISKPLRDEQVHFLGRLIHFFEYMMKNLYEPPQALVEQIDANLFRQTSGFESRPSAHAKSSRDKDSNNKEAMSPSGKMYFQAKEVEDAFTKCITNAQRPKFYYLSNADTTATKDVPKLDGMSLNFVLSATEPITYDDIYDSLIRVLNVASQVDLQRKPGSGWTFLGVCATQFAFTTAWRVLHQLPPSPRALERLTAHSASDQISAADVLFACIWSPRLSSNKWYYFWIRDALVKISQNTSEGSALRPESLLNDVIQRVASLDFVVRLLVDFGRTIVDQQRIPSLLDMFTLEAVLGRTLTQLDMSMSFADATTDSGEPSSLWLEGRAASLTLLPTVISLTSSFYSYLRRNLFDSMADVSMDHSPEYLAACEMLLRMSSGKVGKLASLSVAVSAHLPKPLKKILETWNSVSLEGASVSWRSADSSTFAAETALQTVQSAYFSNLLAYSDSSNNSQLNFVSHSLKRILNVLIKFTENVFSWSIDSANSNRGQAALFDEYATKVSCQSLRFCWVFHCWFCLQIVIPLTMDSCLESFSNDCAQSIDIIFGTKDSDEFIAASYFEALDASYSLITKYSQQVDEKVLIECVRFMETLLSANAGQAALEKFFCDMDGHELVEIFMSPATYNLSAAYATRILKLFVRLFETTDKNADAMAIPLVRLCSSMMLLGQYTTSDQSNENGLVAWLNKVLGTKEDRSDELVAQTYQENRSLLQTLTTYIVKVVLLTVARFSCVTV